MRAHTLIHRRCLTIESELRIRFTQERVILMRERSGPRRMRRARQVQMSPPSSCAASRYATRVAP